MAAVRDGVLQHPDYVIISFLYGRADTAKLGARVETPKTTLSRIAEGINWTKTDDALYKRLKRLRDKPENWFDYRIEGTSFYHFTLYPDAPEAAEIVSDRCPTSEELPRPSSETSESPLDCPVAPADDASTSDLANARVGKECPTSPSICPSSEHAAKPTSKPLPSSGYVVPVRVLQNSQRNLSVKTNLEYNTSQEDTRNTTLEGIWSDTTRPNSERAISDTEDGGARPCRGCGSHRGKGSWYEHCGACMAIAHTPWEDVE